MKALVYDAKKDIAIKEWNKPRLKPGEILIKVKRAGICGSDILASAGGIKRIVKPVVLGHEFTGEIVEIANEEDKNKFTIGQLVAVEPLISCGHCEACRTGNYHVCKTLGLFGLDKDGGMTEYVSVPNYRVYSLPASLSYERAALCEPFAVAVHMVRRSGLRIGNTVIIFGAGPIGLAVAMVAREAGAAKIVLNEVNEYRIKLAREMGFVVVNGKEIAPVDKIFKLFGIEGADISFELSAHQECLHMALKTTKIRGTVLLGGLFHDYPSFDAQSVTLKEQAIIGSRVYGFKDFETAISLLANDKFPADKLISRTVSLDEAIPRGFEAIKKGEDVMKVLINPQ